MSSKVTFIRKNSEASKSPRKSHGKLAAATKIKKELSLNARSKQKKATKRNPHGKSHKPGK